MDTAKLCELAGRYLDGDLTAHGPSLDACTGGEWTIVCEEVASDRKEEESLILETALPFLTKLIARLNRDTEQTLPFCSGFVQRKLLWAARQLDDHPDHVFVRRDIVELDEAITKYRRKKASLDAIAAEPKPKPRRRVA